MPTDDTRGPSGAPDTHKLELHTQRVKGPTPGRSRAWLRFWGTCSCGDESGMLTTAGMVHGWHAQHKEDADNA